MNFSTMSGEIALACLMAVSPNAVQGQGTTAPDASPASLPWHSDHVVAVAGLADVKPNSSGSLSLTHRAIAFAGKDVEREVPFDRITAVSIGDERVATGGVGAKVARAIPLYGFGAAMGAVTNKKVDLLTIEYLDMNGGYHGAVFEVPKTQAVVAQQQLKYLAAAPPVIESQTCRGVAGPRAILVSPILISGVDLPAEYRVLLYEQLVEELGAAAPGVAVYRVGDAAVPCGARKLELSVSAFKKGNEAVRTSTGPVGLFVGGTSVTFHVRVADPDGTVFFERSQKVSKRGDGDSLSVAHSLAKSVSRRLAKIERSEASTGS